MEQVIFTGDDAYEKLEALVAKKGYKRMLMVCGKSYFSQHASVFFSAMEERVGLDITYFSDYTPNPDYEEVVRGVEAFREAKCDVIAAVGGGSAMDVAKCINIFATMEGDTDYLAQVPTGVAVDMMSVPTTAGTGSEATRFAVIYRDGIKLSVDHEDSVPGYVLFDPSLLVSLPVYHKTAAMLDALCHAIESAWSKRATAESKKMSGSAIKRIRKNMEDYLACGSLTSIKKADGEGTHRCEKSADACAGRTDAPADEMARQAHLAGENFLHAAEQMQIAAYDAGRAINITTTTAGHAMSYSLTQLYGIAHGHAAALCVSRLWPFMLEHGLEPVQAGDFLLDGDAAERFSDLVKRLGMDAPHLASSEELDYLCRTVNLERLANNPVALGAEDIRGIYMDILGDK